MSINRVNLSGNITREPELRSTKSGQFILSFGLAVNERRKNRGGDGWENYANFFDCSIFGTRAESVARFLSKGMKVAVDGRLHYSAWEVQDGSKRSKVEVYVDEIEFMDKRPENPSFKAPAPEQAPETEVYDSDIPF